MKWKKRINQQINQMETFLFYILRISIASAILYLFYKLILSKNVLHNYNRMVILLFYFGSLLTACFTFDLSWMIPRETTTTLDLSQFNTSIAASAPAQQPVMNIDWLKIIFLLYVAGLIICIMLFLISFIKMINIILRSGRNKLNDNVILCISDANISPFSWMNYLVLSKSDYIDNHQTIIQHEEAHIRYHHSLDMIIANTFIFFLWFNPFAWLLRKELQAIHEYQADKKVISAGADAKEYQLLLIRRCVGEKKFMLANNFEYNHLQKRIKMLMKTNSVTQKRWIYALIPILLIAVSVILSAENLQAKIKINEDNFNLKNDSIKRELKTVIIGDTAFVTETVNGKVTTSKMIGKQSIDSIKGRNTMIFKTVEKDGAKITVKVTPKDFENSDAKPLFLLDGKEITDKEMKNVEPNEIESINVLKDKSATTIYGEKGKNGVIIITSKNNKNTLGNPTYIVDGVYSEKGVVDKIDASDIASVNVLKGNEAIKMYGENGKNGVVTINTKRTLNIENSPVKEDVMNYIQKQKTKKMKSARIEGKDNKVITAGINDKNTAIFINGQLADVKALQRLDYSKIRVINSDPISNFPEMAVKYNLRKERIVQVFTK